MHKIFLQGIAESDWKPQQRASFYKSFENTEQFVIFLRGKHNKIYPDVTNLYKVFFILQKMHFAEFDMGTIIYV